MKPRKPKWIAAISPSKRASRDAYNRDARLVVGAARILHCCCPVMLWLTGDTLLVECVHHLRGKGCEVLRHDRRGWFLGSIEGHGWIHQHMAEARDRGWICPLGKWGTPFKPDEPPMPGSVADLEAKNILRPQGTAAKVDLSC